MYLTTWGVIAGSIARIVSNDNPQLARDVEESGRFITLFYTEIDSEKKIIRWVPAGRNQGPIYNPATDSFEELVGKGLPIGVTEDSEYKKSHRKISPGQVIVIGTDGIWETHNPQGDAFGKEALREIIRAHVKQPAREILRTVINALEDFRSSGAQEDDVTLVIIKVEQ